jgi:hypothetical protein
LLLREKLENRNWQNSELPILKVDAKTIMEK